jgi:type I restriction enzyme R subunit
LFKSKEEIEQEIEKIKDVLFRFNCENAEIFSQQITAIEDRELVRSIKKALSDSKSLYNLIRLYGHFDLLEKINFQKLGILYREASNHLDLLNFRENLNSGVDTTNILNVALEDVIFMFRKIKEEELILADKLKNILRITREALAANFDQQDPQFATLKEELERLFKKKNLNEVTQDEMNENIDILNQIHDRVKELNRENALLKSKYGNDPKYARIHKRLLEKGTLTEQERKIFEALSRIKEETDEQVLQNTQILKNESYFNAEVGRKVIKQFRDQSIDSVKYINALVVREYMDEFNGGIRAW